MRTYPTSTSNRNVPSNVYLLAEVTEGETNITYYATEGGALYKVGDWATDEPHPAFLSEVCRLTGDGEMMISARVDSFFYWRNNVAI